MEHNNIDYKRLSYLTRYPEDIPTFSGIYFWVYWPDFRVKSTDLDGFKEKMQSYTKSSLIFSEELKGTYKFYGFIYEQRFRNNGNIFGLTDRKEEKFLEYLEHQTHLERFASIFKELCFARPFYVGKANDLNSRLNYHFNHNTPVLDKIDKLDINHTEIWVGYKKILDPNNEGLNNIIEEIFSRVIKPGLTKQPY